MSPRDARFAQSQTALSRSVGPDVLLAATEGDEIEVLSGTAAVIWRFLDTPSTLGHLVEVLADVYRRPPDAIAGDIEALLQDLMGRGFLVTVKAEDDEGG